MTVAHDMPNDMYRQSYGLSHSEAKLMRMKTPHHLHMQRTRPPSGKPAKSTPQMILGSAVHCAVLEPSTFEQRYCEDLDLNRNSNAYKEFAAHCATQGLIALSAEERERVFAMRDSLYRDEQIAEALSTGDSEVSAWWSDPETQIVCKCRPDRVRPTRHGAGALLLDLKTTADASQSAFSKSIHNFGYHTQCDWYVDGYARAAQVEVDGMLFVVVESDFPYACAAYTLDEAALDEAKRLNARVRQLYKQCSVSGVWPGYAQGVQEIGLPYWAYSRETEPA